MKTKTEKVFVVGFAWFILSCFAFFGVFILNISHWFLFNDWTFLGVILPYMIITLISTIIGACIMGISGLIAGILDELGKLQVKKRVR